MSITHGLPTSVPPLVVDPSHLHDDHAHDHGAHGHSHGLVDPSIVRSRAGVKAVLISFGVLGAAALVQTLIFVASGSVALLADLIHNFGDALTAIPLGIAFVLRSARGERLAGLAVVGAIFISACVALYESIERLVHPQHLSHLWALAAAGVVGFAANEIAARVRLRAGRRLDSPALIADGNHARVLSQKKNEQKTAGGGGERKKERERERERRTNYNARADQGARRPRVRRASLRGRCGARRSDPERDPHQRVTEVVDQIGEQRNPSRRRKRTSVCRRAAAPRTPKSTPALTPARERTTRRVVVGVVVVQVRTVSHERRHARRRACVTWCTA